MTPSIYDLWAKTNDRDRAGGAVWLRHPLPLHLIDVALVAEAWLDADAGLFQRFCEIWPTATPVAVRRALVLAAAVHDLGKVYPEFQAKSPEGWACGYATTWKSTERPEGSSFDHGAGTARIFASLFDRRYGDVPAGVDPRWEPLSPLFHVAAGHHGTLYDPVAPDPDLTVGPWFSAVVELLDEVIHHFGAPPEVPDSPPPPFLLLAAGFVSVADWFGSNAHYFPPTPDVAGRAGAEVYISKHRHDEKAGTAGTGQRALADAGLLAEFQVPESFAARFTPEGETEWSPNAGFQRSACEVEFGRTPGSEIAIVEAPMGSGKTEIALSLAADALQHGTADGFYLALPTQATANALFGRVQRFAGRLIGEADLALALAHGAKRFVSEHDALRRASVQRAFASVAASAEASDPAPRSEVVAPSWLQPSKRALLAPVGVGTIDQALLGAMGVRHGFVRLFALARKVVVIDEVHAYDAYMGSLLDHLLCWFAVLGTKVILLSATLPAGLRARLLAAYGATDAVEEPDAYPRLVHGRPDAPPRVTVDPRAAGERSSTTLRIKTVEGADAETRTKAGVAWVEERLERDGCIAWIRNTVREAQDAYGELTKAGVPVVLLHARFARADRNHKEDELFAQLGPPGKAVDRPDRFVVVATQVVEQSVDLDFDAMLSDLAPVDLLLQRAGRLWRHSRPGGRHAHTEPVLGVLMPDAEARAALTFGPSSYVYDADTLARSAVLALASETWALPGACRTLVSELYDGGDEPWTADRLGADADHLVAVRDRLAKQRRTMAHAARRTLLSRPNVLPTVRDARHDRSDAGAHVALVTRYGAHSAAAALFRATPAGPVPVGAQTPLSVPPSDDIAARLRADEAVELASVSFPWYGPRPDEVDPPESLAVLHRWWRQTHPYDDRLFVLIEDDGEIVSDAVRGRYSPDTGLHLARKSDAPVATPPFEDL